MRNLLCVLLAIWTFGVNANQRHDYLVTAAADLATLTVLACPRDSTKGLVATTDLAARFLRRAVALPSGRSIRPGTRRLDLSQGERCIEYVVDLAGASKANQRYQRLHRSNRAVAIPHWLWLPDPPGAIPIEVFFELLEEQKVSVPWTELPAQEDGRPHYRIPNSPRSDDGVSVFGRFENCRLRIAGANLRVAAVRGTVAGHPQELFNWVANAAANVATSYGRFPNELAQIILIPSARNAGDREEPVPFGKVIRDGGEAVVFFINQQRRQANFVADWTATHEFAHLLIPYINNDENWISEGLASYYQNVLMARGGTYSAAKAWRKIVQGFKRGEKSVPHLSLQNAMPIGSWDGIMKTYWGGAAIFMMADVELREHSDGADSLDQVLEKLQACCLPSSRSWNGRRFFRKLDQLSTTPVFEQLYERYRDAPGFPDYEAYLRRLGVRLTSRNVKFDRAAPSAAVATAIMAGPHRARVNEPAVCVAPDDQNLATRNAVRAASAALQ